jgi:hypothetical protein
MRSNLRHPHEAGVEAYGKITLLLLVREINQIAKLPQQRLRRGVGPLRVLDRQLLLAIPETHYLNKPA